MGRINKISIGGEVFDFSLPSSMAGKGLSVQEDGTVKLDLSFVALGTGVDVSGIVKNIRLGTGLSTNLDGGLELAIGTGLNNSTHNCLTLDLSTSAIRAQYNVNGVTKNIKLGTGLIRNDDNAVLYIDSEYVKSLPSIASGAGISVTPHGGTPINGVTEFQLSTGIASETLSGNSVAIRLDPDVLGDGLSWSNDKICVNTNFFLTPSVLGTGLAVSDDNKLTLSTKACGTGMMLSAQNQLMLSSGCIGTGCLYDEGGKIYIDEAYVKSIFEKLINEMNA